MVKAGVVGLNRFNVDAINKVGISGIGDFCFVFKPLWLIATDRGNRDTLNCRYHNHAFFELHIILKGSLIYDMGENKVKVPENRLIIIPPKCRHKVVENGGDIEKFTVAFGVDEKSGIADSIQSITNRPVVLDENSKAQLERIFYLIDSKHSCKEEQIYLLLCGLLYSVMGSLGKAIRRGGHLADCDDRVFKAKKYIEDNFDVFFTCQEVAAYCNISEKQLGRLFLKYENMSLSEYIHRKKISAIKKMFKEGNASHKQISAVLGFSSPQYYGSFIRRMTGESPEEFRKKVIKN